jgi:hypothetical protein
MQLSLLKHIYLRSKWLAFAANGTRRAGKPLKVTHQQEQWLGLLTFMRRILPLM